MRQIIRVFKIKIKNIQLYNSRKLYTFGTHFLNQIELLMLRLNECESGRRVGTVVFATCRSCNQ
jgi:hypothetical protein